MFIRLDITISALSLLLFFYVYLNKRQDELRCLRGPPSPSFLLGIEHHLRVGKLTETLHAWAKRYGTVYRIKGCFGHPMLVISDPRAIHRIFNESVQDYPEAREVRRFVEMLFGKGVTWAIGEDHKRHRRVLGPAFSTNHPRQFLPVFRGHAVRYYQLAGKWTSELQGQDRNIDIIPWFHKVSLDIIGESVLNHQFHALDGKPNELTQTLYQLEEHGLDNTPLTTLLVALPRHIPSFLVALQGKYFPTAIEKTSQRYLTLSNAKAKEVINKAGLDSVDSVRTGEKRARDVLSVLTHSNRQEDPKKRLSDAEILAQIPTLIQAGHHTTGYTLSWIFYELSAHPEDQAKVYREIEQARERNPGEFTSSDYDSMAHLTLVLKEAMRLHSVIPSLDREAIKNDLLLLDFPVTSENGKIMRELTVKKGQRIRIDMFNYNRLESVWGEGATEWDSSRHARMDLDSGRKQVRVGLFANLLNFSGGPKGCLGWRFALMEIQAIVVCLLERFEFAIPPGLEVEPICPAVMTLVTPSVKGKEEEGPQLPLKITPRRVVG